jgi:hypothetical protein
VTITERALDKALTIFRGAGVMPPTDEDGWARIDGAWVRLEQVGWGDGPAYDPWLRHMNEGLPAHAGRWPVYRVVEP